MHLSHVPSAGHTGCTMPKTSSLAPWPTSAQLFGSKCAEHSHSCGESSRVRSLRVLALLGSGTGEVKSVHELPSRSGGTGKTPENAVLSLVQSRMVSKNKREHPLGRKSRVHLCTFTTKLRRAKKKYPNCSSILRTVERPSKHCAEVRTKRPRPHSEVVACKSAKDLPPSLFDCESGLHNPMSKRSHHHEITMMPSGYPP